VDRDAAAGGREQHRRPVDLDDVGAVLVGGHDIILARCRRG
jgi:hypothetical protein